MTVYVWRGDRFVEREHAPPPEMPKKGGLPTPYIAGDIKPYRSPLGNWEVTSRSQRREELKRHNLREVDPSERPKDGHNGYFDEKYLKRYGRTRKS